MAETYCIIVIDYATYLLTISLPDTSKDIQLFTATFAIKQFARWTTKELFASLSWHLLLTTFGFLRCPLHEQDAGGGANQALQSGVKVLHMNRGGTAIASFPLLAIHSSKLN